MFMLTVNNVNEALPEGLKLLSMHGIVRESRVGDVITMPRPVVTNYLQPKRRVLFNRARDPNPYFHFLEALWMLGGRNDVEWITRILSNFGQFSDDGVTFHGAYGYRWRKHFVMDQILMAASMLKENKAERRAVVAMWDADHDLGAQVKDVPCNTHIYFRISPKSGALDMTVCCRSNDIVWGAYGSNVVHMSMLQELVAAIIGVEVGVYSQVSNDYHAYLKVLEEKPNMDVVSGSITPYDQVDPYPMINVDPKIWLQDLDLFLENPESFGYRDQFFRRVAIPILRSHEAYRKRKDPDRFNKALEIINQCAAADWRIACIEWLEARMEKANSK